MEDQEYFQLEEFQYLPLTVEEEQESKQDCQSTQVPLSSPSELYTNNKSQGQLCLIQNKNAQNSKRNEQKQLSFVNIDPLLFNQNKTLNLYTGLQVTNDGVIRFSYALDQVSFGFQQQHVIQVTQNHQLGLLNIQFSQDFYDKKQPFQEALNFLSHVPNIKYDQVSNILTQTSFMIENMKNVLRSVVFEDSRSLKDQEYQLYLKHCSNYLQFYNQNNPNSMYCYTILRLNIHLGDSEIAHTGYSKSYLELLGIDGSSLSQIILRNKQIDLIQNKGDITYQALQGISKLALNLDLEYYESHILTFDGFPIKLFQRKKSVPHGFQSSINGIECQYGFIITEMDVDLFDLQQLILYRQRLIQQSNTLEYDDFLRKELSFRFEDVEYSIHSQLFIEKYYADNICKLKELQHLKQNNQSKIKD